MTIYRVKKNQLLFFMYIYLYIPLNPFLALQSKDFSLIDSLVNSCYENSELCDSALFKINNYQKSAAIKNNLSCQTRLLGLEANLIMAMNSKFKRKESKSIFYAIKKYC